MEGEVLAYPDHPLLLNGPSVLVLANNVLRALFVYTSNSRSASSAAEQARVLLARLAYPKGTVFEAIFEDGSRTEGADDGLFDSFRVRGGKVLSQPDGDQASHAQVSCAIERLRSAHFARFAANQQGVHQEILKSARTAFTQFSPAATSRYKFVEAGPYGLAARVPEGNRAVTVKRMERVAESFVASDYGLDQGVSGLIRVAEAAQDDFYLEQHSLYAGAFLASEHKGGDVGKPLRVAQFGGGLVKRAW